MHFSFTSRILFCSSRSCAESGEVISLSLLDVVVLGETIDFLGVISILFVLDSLVSLLVWSLGCRLLYPKRNWSWQSGLKLIN